MRVVYLGTAQFAVEVLRRLATSDHRPVLVVTPPDRRRGRGRRLASPPVADAARELGLELLQAEDVNDPEAVAAIRGAAPDLAAVCAFGQLIREPLLGQLEMLNVHPSLLPRWRGAAPIERAIMAGDAESGVTIMRVTPGLDSGPVALREAIPVDSGADYGSLSARLAELAGELVVRALGLHAERGLSFVEQDESLATYADKVAPSERRLDPARPAIELERTVRALTPHIGAHLELEGGERLGVRSAAALPAMPAEGPATGATAAMDGALLVGTGEGVLRVSEVQPAGGRAMDAAAYLRGHGPPRLAGA